MAETKIAPAIEAVIGWPPPYGKLGITAAKVSIQAVAELAALRAVARAAMKAGPYMYTPDDLRMGRALARLERARKVSR